MSEELICRSCGKPIVFMLTAKGRRMPVDKETWSEGETDYDPVKHWPHFASCPAAKKWRRPRGKLDAKKEAA